MNDIEIVFIAGSGRSGSTLIERFLAESYGYCGCGELRYFWERNCIDGDVCSCGESVENCQFWSGFFSELDVSGKEYAKKVISIKSKVDFNKYLIFGFDEALVNEFLALIIPLYRYAYEKSGRIVIDSSKHPSYLALLSKSSEVRIYCLHVLRDPRAVAFSWSKKVRRPEVESAAVYMPTFSALRVSVQWVLYNLWFRLNRRDFFAYYSVSYEDFCFSPNIVSSRLLTLTGKNFADREKLFHSVAGNPMRFRDFDGITVDESWRGKATGLKYFFVLVLTFPVKLIFKFLPR